jgi:glycerol-3-phosphate dehydrogenase (NAD(P)+)
MIGIIGAGAFGTALAVALARAGARCGCGRATPRRCADARDAQNPRPAGGRPAGKRLYPRRNRRNLRRTEALLLAMPMQALGGALERLAADRRAAAAGRLLQGRGPATLRGPVALIEARRPGARLRRS